MLCGKLQRLHNYRVDLNTVPSSISDPKPTFSRFTLFQLMQLIKLDAHPLTTTTDSHTPSLLVPLLIGTIAHPCKLVPDTTAFAQTPAHSPHSARLPTKRGCETHAGTLTIPIKVSPHHGHSLFPPLAAMLLNPLAFPHNTRHKDGFADAVEPEAASSPVA